MKKSTQKTEILKEIPESKNGKEKTVDQLKADIEEFEKEKDKAYVEALAKLNKEFGREVGVNPILFVRRNGK